MDKPRVHRIVKTKKTDFLDEYVKIKSFVQIANREFPESRMGFERNGDFALVSTSLPYEITTQWEGGSARDYALVDLRDGSMKDIATEIS